MNSHPRVCYTLNLFFCVQKYALFFESGKKNIAFHDLQTAIADSNSKCKFM